MGSALHLVPVYFAAYSGVASMQTYFNKLTITVLNAGQISFKIY
jgi:hypothetical protein